MQKGIKFSKKTIIALLITGSIAVVIPFTVRAYNNHNYNIYLSRGQAYLSSGYYEDAVLNFDNALKYNTKDRQEINSLIERAVLLKQSEAAFDKGIRLVYEKNYLNAITEFEKVSENDDLRYEVAQKKIEECKKTYSENNIAAAQNEAASGKYEAGLLYIEAVLKIDPLNRSAITLKNQYNNIIAARAAEQQEKAAERMLKQASGINITTSMNNNE